MAGDGRGWPGMAWDGPAEKPNTELQTRRFSAEAPLLFIAYLGYQDGASGLQGLGAFWLLLEVNTKEVA